MAYLKITRDKRGYEHFYLVEPIGRRDKVRQKILYWFRTPPGVKVGREPFDPQVRKALEEQNPRVSFDWPRVLSTPVPPPAPDVERWREKRKAEKAAKQAAREEAAAAVASPEVQVVSPEAPAPSPETPAPSPETPAPNPQSSRRRRRRRRGRGGQGRPEIAAVAGAAPSESVEPGAPDESGEEEPGES